MDTIDITLPATFAVPYPKGVKNGEDTTFDIAINHWTDSKRAAVFGFALKEYANNKAGGKEKTDDDVLELLTQETFDAWVPASGGGRSPSADVAFVVEMRLRLRNHLGMKMADIMEWTKGFDSDRITDFARTRIARRMGASATEADIQRVLDGHLAKIATVLDARAETADEEPVTE